VVDNDGFQSINGLQQSCGSPSFNNERRFRREASGRTDGEVVPVDFRAHAEAMGATAFGARNADELQQALQLARRTDGVSVVVVRTNPKKRVPGFDGWWDVPVAQVSGQPDVNAARAAYDGSVQGLRRRG
jgi:3D-(3,5/4)-trihydroxycyclohexane-1,2-dione acylhydrolase (decyclizing)